MIHGAIGELAMLAQAGVPRAATIVGAEPATAAPWEWSWVFGVLIVAGVVVAIGGYGAFWWTRRTPLEQAFAVLSVRLGLGRGERRLVRELAGAGAVEPVVLLLSEQAFESAMAARRGAGESRVAARVRQRVFG
ncbi:MAG: hypothetical protein AB7K52_12085 [Phycisphaerales bacterium]